MINGTVVDTSIWVNYLSQKNDLQVNVTNAIIESKSLHILPVILHEVLQGIEKDDLFNIIQDNFRALRNIEYDNYEAALQSAMMYRFLQKKGITIRKPNDCLIAVLCIEFNLSLYHCDRDFDNIAKHTSLKIYK